MLDNNLGVLVSPVHSNDDNSGTPSIPILRTFAQARPAKILSGLAELSFIAGRFGDDEWAWRNELDDALVDAFHFERASHIDWACKARTVLEAAFKAGVAQRLIDLADKSPAPAALAVAVAYATIYLDEIQHPSEARPSAIDAEVGYVSKKLAERHPLSPAEAAHIAMHAFRDQGLQPSISVAAWALDRASLGHEERVGAENRATARAATSRAWANRRI